MKDCSSKKGQGNTDGALAKVFRAKPDKGLVSAWETYGNRIDNWEYKLQRIGGACCARNFGKVTA